MRTKIKTEILHDKDMEINSQSDVSNNATESASIVENVNAVDSEGGKELRRRQLQKEAFIVTPTNVSMLQTMEDLLRYPTRGRMPCLRLIGSANCGKSSLLQKFANTHPRFKSSTDYSDKLPVAYFLIYDGTEKGFYDSALDAMKAKIATSHNTGQKRMQFLRTCQELEVKMLILDEFHNAGHGTGKQQSTYCAFIKNVTNILRIPIIVSGTEDVKTFINSDPQLNSRFIYQMEIKPWQLNMEFRGFLKGMEKNYQLKKPSNLASTNELAKKILDLTDGLTGDIVHLLEFAAIEAINSGQEQITLKILESLVESGIWTQPSLRGP